jgi:hypothetical protein
MKYLNNIAFLYQKKITLKHLNFLYYSLIYKIILMSKSRSNCITPYKLLNQVKEFPQKASLSIPLRQIILKQAKTPKLFSSLRPPSTQPRPSLQKYSNIGLPSFLSEYLNQTETDFSSRVFTSKLFTNTKQLRKNSSEVDSKIKKKNIQHKEDSLYNNKVNCFTPVPNFYEIEDSRKVLGGSLYKPYMVKISPRAKIRLYSQSPIGIEADLRCGRRNRSVRNNYQTTIDGDFRKDTEVKAGPVFVEQYTKTYADKLKRVLEITEEARVEAEKLQI